MAFRKVSMETWLDFNNKNFAGSEFLPRTDEKNYMKIAKPERSTKYSAGYDFRLPFDVNIPANTPVVVPTGIIADMNHLFEFTDKNNNKLELANAPSVFLALYPRSSLGFKYGFKMLNTIPIIDSDYVDNKDNEGHILVGFKTDVSFVMEQGTKFCQGIIQPYFIMEDDSASGVRTGGVGSTGK